MNRWDSGGINNLSDKKKSGRPKVLTASEKKIVEATESGTIRRIKVFAAELTKSLKKKVGHKMVKRLLRQHGSSWKRNEEGKG